MSLPSSINLPSSVKSCSDLLPCLDGTLATNLRRLMAREGLTYDDVVAGSGLDERTIRGVMQNTQRPHARTLHKLANGLGVLADELFRPPAEQASSRQTPAEFDRACNPSVGQVIADHPELFAGWSETDFDELASRFGVGGPLSETGILAAAQAMNRKHQIFRQVAILLETGNAELLCAVVDTLYQRVVEDHKREDHKLEDDARSTGTSSAYPQPCCQTPRPS